MSGAAARTGDLREMGKVNIWKLKKKRLFNNK